MDGEEIVRLRLAHPFKQFSLVLSDGRKLLVDKPYHLAISFDRRLLLWSSLDGGFEKIDSRQVTDAVPVPSKTRNGNSKYRKRRRP